MKLGVELAIVQLKVLIIVTTGLTPSKINEPVKLPVPPLKSSALIL
ncbi:MAG: hypothetical protein LBD88_01310 [Candidatus Peribacteria bacterium]|nr:hypothetical protein [Candidatus Peribacteria bacterium]